MTKDTAGTITRATLDDLMREEGKAELIGGEIVRFMSTGKRANLVALEIVLSLRAHARATGVGVAYSDGIGFAVPELASGRESFGPDAAYHVGPPSAGEGAEDFVLDAPTFAVEVRSKWDVGPAAERAMAAKRLDYFEAGTLVVWDVDPEAGLIRSYRRDAPEAPTTFTPGGLADAEPAVPGWRADPADFFG